MSYKPFGRGTKTMIFPINFKNRKPFASPESTGTGSLVVYLSTNLAGGFVRLNHAM